MLALPLAGRRVIEGKRILVTRAAHQASKLSDALRALGAEPVEVPVLEIRPPESFAPLDAALGNLGEYDWLIFTSANAVGSFAGRATMRGIALPLARSLRVAAVGRATAAAVEQIGLNVDLVPESYVAESLVEELVTKAKCPDALKAHDFSQAKRSDALKGRDFNRAGSQAQRSSALKGHDFSRADEGQERRGALAPAGSFRGQRVLLARAAVARDVLPDALRAAGAQVDVVDAYRNVMPASAPELLRAALERGIDAATFTSSSSVTYLADAARAAGIAFPFAGVNAISIGPITSQTLRDLGWEPAAEANISDISGLIEATADLLTR